MKFIYFTSNIYPRYRASTIQTLWVAKTFSQMLGDSFVFTVGKKQEGDLWRDINYVETGYVFRRFRSLYYFFWFPIFLRKYLHVKKEGGLVLYARDPYLILTTMVFKKLFGYKIVIEYHNPPFGLVLPFGSFVERLIMNTCDYILPTTRSMRNYLVEKYRVSEKKFLVTPNGVDISTFSILDSQEECRKKCGLPKDKKIILYSGHLYDRQGVHTLAQAARFLDQDTLIVFVGGKENFIVPFEEKYKKDSNILIVGNKLPEEVPFWLKSADVLIVPQAATNERAIKEWSCPTKIFEYMASGVPIISSDLPAIREILNDNNSLLIKADDPRVLAGAIKETLSHYESAVRLAQNAYRDVQGYRWSERANNILNFINFK